MDVISHRMTLSRTSREYRRAVQRLGVEEHAVHVEDDRLEGVWNHGVP